MYVAIIEFPSIPAPRDADFRAWFDWSNQTLADAEGLRDRQLLRGDDGCYLGVVEHDTAITFAAMHASPAGTKVRERLQTVLSDAPHARTYGLVSQPFSRRGDCCTQEDGSTTAVGRDRAGDSGHHGCCGGT